MKKFIAGKYKQHQEYRSFTPSAVNNRFVWDNPQINVLLERARGLLGELNAYAELIPDIEIFREIIALRREYEEKVLTLGSRAKNAHKLLRFMFGQPIVNVKLATEELGTALSTVNLLLKSLTELGILKETTGYSRNRLFVLEKYLNLFRS